MVVLVDTNIIIDALANRELYADNAKKILEECAVESMADYIVTRNPADFANSRVKVILPEEFLKKL